MTGLTFIVFHQKGVPVSTRSTNIIDIFKALKGKGALIVKEIGEDIEVDETPAQVHDALRAAGIYVVTAGKETSHE